VRALFACRRLSSVNIQGTLSDSVGQLTQLMYL
jgi:hypothetical protein